jgi:hypothetical protein
VCDDLIDDIDARIRPATELLSTVDGSMMSSTEVILAVD